MSIRTRYERELQEIFDKLVLMCRHIEVAIEKSVSSITERDPEIAQQVFEIEELIDRMERDIEQACLKILMMEQPVARDFREISAVLKMITDLERIGDQARDIAEISMQIGADYHFKKLVRIPQMSVIVIQMVKDGVLSYINRDVELARSLDKTDDKVDSLFNHVMKELIEFIRNNPDLAEQAVLLVMINKYLERIGDHAVNIGEWVEYAITGQHPKSEIK